MKNIYIVFVVLLTIQFQLPNYNQGNYVLRVRDSSSQYMVADIDY